MTKISKFSNIDFYALPLLKNLSPENKALIAQTAHVRRFKRKDSVRSDINKRLGLGFVLSGRLQCLNSLSDGRPVGLYVVEEGQSFGEIEFFQATVPVLNFVALEESEVAFLDPSTVHNIWFGNLQLAREFAQVMSERTASILNQRLIQSAPNVVRRLCMLLDQNPKFTGSLHTVFKNLLTQQEMALMIDTSRETVTRIFKALMDQKVIAKDNQVIYLLNPTMLKHIADGVVTIG